MSRLYGLIPAAGKGTRARPYSKEFPKCMLDINGIPNLLRNIIIMRDDLGIEDICIIIGYQGRLIKDYFGDGSKYGVNITYVENNFIDKGLAYSILLGKKHIKDYCCVILSDECYLHSNHHDLLSFPYNDSIATCALMQTDDRELIKQNYAVEIYDNRITRLIEKPTSTKNDLLGCGTFMLSFAVFEYLDEAFNQPGIEYVDFITFLNQLCNRGEKVLPFRLKGIYVNINDHDSLYMAKYLARNENFEQNIITLLIYSEGDEKELAFTINRYKQLAFLNHIYVIVPYDNQLESTIAECHVSYIKCPPEITLYGEKQKYALEHVPGDILILCDADYSFPNRDIVKLLAYIREADMVVGTRTTQQLIEQGTNMRRMVRFGNILLAKVLKVLWRNQAGWYTDVQCIFRAIWKNNFEKIRNRLNCKGAGFGAEMIIEVLRDRDIVIEIPVNYTNRPYSAYHKYQNFRIFFEILFLICKKRIQLFIHKK